MLVVVEVVVVELALEKRERLRGVVYGDAADGPHGSEVLHLLIEDGLGVLQELQPAEVAIGASCVEAAAGCR
jgi:hypothetical protein